MPRLDFPIVRGPDTAWVPTPKASQRRVTQPFPGFVWTQGIPNSNGFQAYPNIQISKLSSCFLFLAVFDLGTHCLIFRHVPVSTNPRIGRVQEVWLPAAEVAWRIPEGLGAGWILSCSESAVTGSESVEILCNPIPLIRNTTWMVPIMSKIPPEPWFLRWCWIFLGGRDYRQGC